MEWSQVSSLAEALSAEMYLPVADQYFFLVRIGNNWQDYSFDWGPFIDLAAALEERVPDSGTGLPIVLVSLDSTEPSPSSQRFSSPAQHLRIVVSPAAPVAAVVETWLTAIAEQLGPSARIADSSLLPRLGLDPGVLSRTAASLVTPGMSRRPLELSGLVLDIAHSFGTANVSVVQIAAALAQQHPEYAGGQFRTAVLQGSPTLPTRSWQAWLEAIGPELDMEAVALSRHRVVDGRLLLFALALVDQVLLAELERVGVWSPLLFEIDEKAVPTGNAHAVLSSLRFAHGYISDLPGGEDRLDIQGEVVALCDVITDPNVLPPLAVGLFGEWGSGKSFFMEKMRENIDGKRAQFESIGRSVVQIRFNAWHYSDTSLWASLAITIFERLADPEPVSVQARRTWLAARGDPDRAQRDDLLRQLESYRAARAEKDAEIDRLEAEHAALDKRRQDAEGRRAKAAERTPLTDVLRAVRGSKRVTDALGDVSGALGFTPSVYDLLQLNRELQTTGGYFLASWRQLRHKSLAAMLTTVAVLLGLATAALIVHGGIAAWGSIATAVATVTTVTTGVVKGAKPAVAGVNRAIALLQNAIDVTAEVQDSVRTTRMREELELNALVDAINREVEQAYADMASLDRQIEGLKTSADAMSVERQLYDFLSDRAAGYQRHQGIVGILHRDFQLLEAKLLAQYSGGELNPALPRIDRIILYIDDLDRCQPAKVLEVLEAVHLLLALELFVVVVGVDPRWLQRSLWHEYRESLGDGTSAIDDYLRSMPVEYLEKIFQIPLTLPAMNSTGFAKLIAGLAPSVLLTSGDPATETRRTQRHGTAEGLVAGGSGTPTRAPLVDAASAPHVVNPTPVDLTPAEVRFAQRLGHLVGSPRAAKRLMNTYRLIRATQHVGTRSRFLGTDGRPGEYIPLLTLLAVAAGFPTVLDRLLTALEHDSASARTWSDFVNRLAPRERGNDATGLPRRDPQQSADRRADGESAAWRNLQGALAADAKTNGVDDIEAFRRWGPLVARFSFTI